jgi:hypothetical protein
MKFVIFFLIITLASAGYTFKNRYYLRFVPLPLSIANVINEGSWLLPASQPATPLGKLDFGNYDLRTEEGLRKTLNLIQGMSPFANTIGMPSYTNITFKKWVREITSKPFFCTDGTQLFILAAMQQGLQAREWHLLPPGWPTGQGHSVAEFYNPATGRWQLVDAQHAGIVRGTDGGILDMLSVLKAYKENRNADIRIDYGPYRSMMLKGARGPSTEDYFFKAGLLQTPVLQLRQATWFATVARRFGLSGQFVIGYPIVMETWTHDYRIWVTKLTAALMIVFGFLTLGTFFARRKRLKTG